MDEAHPSRDVKEQNRKTIHSSLESGVFLRTVGMARTTRKYIHKVDERDRDKNNARPQLPRDPHPNFPKSSVVRMSRGGGEQCQNGFFIREPLKIAVDWTG